MTPVTGPHYISGAEAARLLGVDKLTIRRWHERGVLLGHRTPGGRLRIHKAQAAELKRQLATYEGLLTPAQAADELGVALNTVQRWVKEGKLRARMSPTGRTFIDPAEIKSLKSR